MASEISAHIDDTLARVADRRERIVSTLQRLAGREATRLRMRQVGRQLQLLAADADCILVDYLLEASEQEARVIALILREIGGLEARERLQRLQRKFGPGHPLHLTFESVRATFEQQLLPHGLPEDLVAAAPEDVWRFVAGADWRRLTPARTGLIWLENFFPQAQLLRRRLLDFLSEAEPRLFVPVLEMEAHWGGKSNGPYVVRRLRRLSHPSASDALRRLRHHRDATTRNLAQSLAQGMQGRIEIIDPSAVERGGPFPVAHGISPSTYIPPAGKMKAYLCELSDYAHARLGTSPGAVANIVLQTHDERERVNFVSLLADLRDRGLVECFGGEGLSLSEFEDLLESFNTVQPDASFQRIPLALGLAIANAAAALTIRRNHVLPREYFLWRDLVALPPYDARQYQLPMHDAVFGQLDPWQPLVMQRSEADGAFLPW